MVNILKFPITHVITSCVAFFLIDSLPNLQSSFRHREMICLSNDIKVGAFSFYCFGVGLKSATESLLGLYNNSNYNNL